jgi:hypothetical protein
MILTTKEMAFLLPAFADQTALSLFSNLSATPDGTEHASLTKKGIIQGNSYSPEALEMLLLIAKPERCSRLVVQNEYCIIEKYTYKSGNKAILAENSNGELLFSQPQDFGDVIISLSDLFGLSKIKTIEIFVSLQADELVVLLAIIDIFRKDALMACAGKPTASTAVSVQDITNELSSNFENGLVKILTKNFSCKIPSAQDIGTLLASLIQKNCIAFEQGYKLTESYAALAKTFLVPEAIVLFETFELQGKDELSAAGSVCVTAGLHDIISFSLAGNIIEFSTLSATQMLYTIEEFLNCPTFIKETMQTTPAAAPANNIWGCSCGNTNTEKFCSFCGNQRPK